MSERVEMELEAKKSWLLMVKLLVILRSVMVAEPRTAKYSEKKPA